MSHRHALQQETAMYPGSERDSKSTQLTAMSLVATGFMFFSCCSCVGVGIMFMEMGGTRTAANMPERSWQHLESYDVLEPGEPLVAYIDRTPGVNGEEACVITERRVFCHDRGAVESVDLVEISEIELRSKDGDNTFTIRSESGETLEVLVQDAEDPDLFGSLLKTELVEQGNMVDVPIPTSN
jgi:hypothetical protein